MSRHEAGYPGKEGRVEYNIILFQQRQHASFLVIECKKATIFQ